MNQYGAGQNVPYSGTQQEADLVNNPRYTGQTTGTDPLGHNQRGPAEESRYGAAPVNTAGVDAYGNPRREGMVDKVKDAVGMGPRSGMQPHDTTRGGPYAGENHPTGVDEYGNPRREGMVDKMKDAAGVGPRSGMQPHDTTRGGPYAGENHPTGVDEYGNPRREGMVDKMKDAAGVGPRSGMQPHDTSRGGPYAGENHPTGVDEYGNPRREGMVDKMKDAVGVGPRSGMQPHDTSRGGPYAGENHPTGVDEYGNPRREGMVDKMKDAAGVGPHSGMHPHDTTRGGPYAGENYPTGVDEFGNPRREGMVDKVKDSVGMGPHSGMHPHDTTRGGPYGGENYPTGVERGPGGGLGGRTTNTGYDQSGLGATGHHHDGVHVVPGTIPMADMGEHRVEPGYDASKGHIGHNHQSTLTGSPRKEGIVEKIKDAVGMGKHDKASHTHPGSTTMGSTVSPNSYGTGEPGLGHHGNTTSTTPGYTHNSMVDTGLGHDRHPGSSTGYHHERVGDHVGGVGPHHGETGADYDYERRGKGFEDAPGMMDDTRTGTGTGYGDTNVGQPQNDATAYGIDSAPPKKGLMTKVKEKLHH